MMRLSIIVALLVALLMGGCTIDDGVGFGRLSARLWSGFAGLEQGAGRLTSDGWFRTSNSFELKLSSLTLTLREIQVRGTAGTGGTSSGCTFDPSSPPAGCSLCHNDHCHCDGELVSYDELEAQVCGGGGGSSTTKLASLAVPGAQNLLGQGTRTEELTCRPSCELDAGQLDGIQVLLDRLQLDAKLRDRSAADRLQGAEPKVALDWDLGGASLSHTLASPELVDRDHPYLVRLALELPLAAGTLDGVDWHQLQRSGGTITIDAKTNKSAGEAITGNLARTRVKVTVTREED
jgi:hypothetical protein